MAKLTLEAVVKAAETIISVSFGDRVVDTTEVIPGIQGEILRAVVPVQEVSGQLHSVEAWLRMLAIAKTEEQRKTFTTKLVATVWRACFALPRNMPLRGEQSSEQKPEFAAMHRALMSNLVQPLIDGTMDAQDAIDILWCIAGMLVNPNLKIL